MDTVRLSWNRPRRFIAWDAAGHGVVMDSKPEYKGDGSGVRPVELVLYGLGGCTGMDVISILEKKRQDVTGLELIVTGEQREEQPRFYDTVHVEYVITGRGVSPAAVERAIELSEEKYCSVRGMFRPEVAVTHSYRIIEEPEAVSG